MSAGDLAAVLVTVVGFATFVVLVVTVQSLLRTTRELRATLDEVRARAVPMIEELAGTVRAAGAEVERVDDLLEAAEAISARVEGASRLGYLAFRAPLVKLLAFARGIGRFLRRLSGRRVAAPAERPVSSVRRAA